MRKICVIDNGLIMLVKHPELIMHLSDILSNFELFNRVDIKIKNKKPEENSIQSTQFFICFQVYTSNLKCSMQTIYSRQYCNTFLSYKCVTYTVNCNEDLKNT